MFHCCKYLFSIQVFDVLVIILYMYCNAINVWYLAGGGGRKQGKCNSAKWKWFSWVGHRNVKVQVQLYQYINQRRHSQWNVNVEVLMKCVCMNVHTFLHAACFKRISLCVPKRNSDLIKMCFKSQDLSSLFLGVSMWCKWKELNPKASFISALAKNSEYSKYNSKSRCVYLYLKVTEEEI